jgi:adenylylsulfate kinase-like enzyme
MYDEVRDWNRNNIDKYVEIFLSVKLETLIERDRKGLYSRQVSGEVSNVAGIDQKVEFPKILIF